MRKRKLALVLSVVCALTSLGACAPKKVEEVPKETKAAESGAPAGTDAGTAGTTAAGADAAASDEVTRISFWKWIPTEGSQTDDLVAAWNASHPNIKVDILHVGEADAYFQKLSAALPAGEGPTVLAMQVGARANQYKEFCEPLAPYCEEKWGAGWEDKFLESALEQCRYSGDDYTVLPGGMTATPVFQYNAGAFKELGIEKVPETMEELYQVIEKTKGNDKMIPGIAIGAKEGWTCRDVFMGLVNQVAPGKIYEAQEGKASFEDPAIVEALQIWKELWDKGLFAEGSLGTALYPDLQLSFMLGGTDGNKYPALLSCGTWHGSGMTKKAEAEFIEKGERGPGVEIGAFTLPPVKEGLEPCMVSTVDIAWGVNSAATEKEKAAAFEFISWLAAEEGQEIWSNSLQILPSAKDVSLDKALGDMRGDTEKAALEMYQYYVENAVGARELKYPEIANTLNDVLVAIPSGTMTPEEAAATVQTASESVTR